MYAQQCIEWISNCPQNPEAGRSCARLVQCMKELFKGLLKETFRSTLIKEENTIRSHLKDEELLTLNKFLLDWLNSSQTTNPGEQNCVWESSGE